MRRPPGSLLCSIDVSSMGSTASSKEHVRIEIAEPSACRHVRAQTLLPKVRNTLTSCAEWRNSGSRVGSLALNPLWPLRDNAASSGSSNIWAVPNMTRDVFSRDQADVDGLVVPDPPECIG